MKIAQILIFILVISSILRGQPENIRFKKITVEDGLSDSRVSCIIQDSKGFMWIGTYNGLNRFDGYTFKIYRNDPADSLSLADNHISSLYQDHSGIMWIGTFSGGLYRYDSNHDTFIHYNTNSDPNSLSDTQITFIFETKQHILWIATGNGINRYNHLTDNFTRYYPDEKNPEFKRNINYINTIAQDSTGQLWTGTWNQGLFKFDEKNDRFIKYKPPSKYNKTFVNQFIANITACRTGDQDYIYLTSYQYGFYRINPANNEIIYYPSQENNQASISGNGAWALFQSKSNKKELWIGTETGLNRFDTYTGQFTRYRYHTGNENGLSNDFINALFEDKSGLLWIGTMEGINIYDLKSLKFRTIPQSAANIEVLYGSKVRTIYETTSAKEGSILWLGTFKGLYSFNRKSKIITGYRHSEGNRNSLTNDIIYSIIETKMDNERLLWVATNYGLNKVNLRSKKITRYLIPTSDPVHNMIITLCEDRNGILWIGTQSSYLYSFEPQSEKFTQYNPHFGTIFHLVMDSSESIWMGTWGGLYKFNPQTKEEKFFTLNNGTRGNTGNNTVWSLLAGKKGIMWISTSDGLFKFDKSSEKLIPFDEERKLSDNRINAIIQDKHDNIWGLTHDGIKKYNTKTKNVRNYYVNENIQWNEFWSTPYMNKQGEIFFGIKDGIISFYPDSITDENSLPDIVLTDFKIFNKSVRQGENSILKRQLSEVPEITLNYDQSIFSFEFAALEFRNPQRINYAYKMENVDPDWVYTDASRRFVTYTQLDPGFYTFQVKTSNSSGIWNEHPAAVIIKILPPWWRTWWAYTLSALLILAILLTLRSYELSRQDLKHRLQLEKVEAEKEHIQAEKFREIDRLKSRFFANISHEFRTPLTLIIGPVQRMLSDEFKGNVKDQYGLILHNSKRLLQLVNQLLDLSRLEEGKMQLHACPGNIVEHTRQLTMAFESLATVKEIRLQFSATNESYIVYFDPENYAKIINNLLSNAIKYTPPGGVISVEVNGLNDCILIKIADSGKGISDGHLPYIFDRFYRAEESIQHSIGSGIGLALVRELVELHHGHIEVNSEAGKGSTFIIRLPLGKKHLKPEDIADSVTTMISDYPGSDLSTEAFEKNNNPAMAAVKRKLSVEKPILLLVEDNRDMRDYIKDLLQESYNVVEATDGRQGYEKAKEIIPDLIISDVMMPEWDGLQFCTKIKNDPYTSHIPVILLTAKSSDFSKLEGLQTGADDYLNKPFNAKELNIRIDNLIQQRRLLREKFQKEIILQPQGITVTSADTLFIQKVISVIEKNITNDTSVEQLADIVAMSRSQLFRKLKALTGQSPLEFIRSIKLKRAANLLKGRAGTVSEVAYQVGFNNPAYFTECFRKQYGVSPKKYINSMKV